LGFDVVAVVAEQCPVSGVVGCTAVCEFDDVVEFEDVHVGVAADDALWVLGEHLLACFGLVGGTGVGRYLAFDGTNDRMDTPIVKSWVLLRVSGC
jgi:hypothetical protein